MFKYFLRYLLTISMSTGIFCMNNEKNSKSNQEILSTGNQILTYLCHRSLIIKKGNNERHRKQVSLNCFNELKWWFHFLF